ncbi:hypothetical protein ACH419_37030 [Streptomyces bobili]|uniref:hypothetical protein n=1 Tax=Streptomyces bobili TaxID=67280 RepID=UPI0037A59F2D
MTSLFVQADATNWLAIAIPIAIDIWTWGSVQTGWQKISSPPDHLPSSGWSPPLESVACRVAGGGIRRREIVG